MNRKFVKIISGFGAICGEFINPAYIQDLSVSWSFFYCGGVIFVLSTTDSLICTIFAVGRAHQLDLANTLKLCMDRQFE